MRIITTKVAASECGISERLVRRLLKNYGMETEKIGCAIILSEAQLDILKKRNTKRGNPGHLHGLLDGHAHAPSLTPRRHKKIAKTNSSSSRA